MSLKKWASKRASGGLRGPATHEVFRSRREDEQKGGKYLSVLNRAEMHDKTANSLHKQGRHAEATVRHKLGAEAHREAADLAPNSRTAQQHRVTRPRNTTGARR